MSNNGNVWHEPIKADVVVSPNRVTGESASTYLFFFRIQGDNEFLDGVEYSSNTSSISAKNVLSFLNPFKIIESVFTGGAEGEVKSAAAFNALANTVGADVLVHPTYQIKKRNLLLFNSYKVTVEGYPGTYANFRHERYEENSLENRINKSIVDKLDFEIDVQQKE